MIHDGVYWLKSDNTSSWINKMKYVTTTAVLLQCSKANVGHSNNFYIFIFYFWFLVILSDDLQPKVMDVSPSSQSLQMKDRAVIHFYYKNPFNFLYQKEIES